MNEFILPVYRHGNKVLLLTNNNNEQIANQQQAIES